MDLLWALIIWLVIVILIYVIAKHNRVRTWSALVLALLVGAIVLGILRPVTVTELTFGGNNLATTIYWLIMFLTPLIIIIYVVSMAVSDVIPLEAPLKNPSMGSKASNLASLAPSRS